MTSPHLNPPRTPLLKKIFRYAIPTLISIGLCYLLFSHLDFHTMVSTVRENCHWQWIWATLTLSVISHIIRAVRWRIQLRAIGINITLYPVILSIFGTYAVNLVFPRLGELWRTGYIANRQKAPFDQVFGSMVADRLADTVTVATLTLITLLLAGPQLTSYLTQTHTSEPTLLSTLISSPLAWTAAAAIIIAAALTTYRLRHTRPIRTAIKFLRGIWQGFAIVAHMKGKTLWLILTIALWACYFTQLYLAFFAFDLTAQFVHTNGITAVLLCFVFSSLSMGVPSNGGIGPWQWAIIFGINLYAGTVPGLDTTQATVFANLVMATQTLLLIILGLYTFISIAIAQHIKNRL